jgi:hypothetical protein
MNRKVEQNIRYCDTSNCGNLVDSEYVSTLKNGPHKTLRQRYCLKCTGIIEDELVRKEWREELGIG